MTTPAVDVDAAALREAAVRLGRRIRKHAGSGLTPSQHSMLATVARHGPLAVGDLARREQLEKSSVTRAVARLEAMGCLARVPDRADGRVVLLTITEAGTELLAAADDRANAYLAELLNELDATQRAAVLEALPALERMVERRR